MRMIPINVEIELAVGASSFEEAVEVVRRGLDEGRYTKEAKIYFDASTVDQYGRIKQYAHGDELKKARSRAAKGRASSASTPARCWSSLTGRRSSTSSSPTSPAGIRPETGVQKKCKYPLAQATENMLSYRRGDEMGVVPIEAAREKRK